MILQEKEGMAWLEFEIFQSYPHIAHGVFLKTPNCLDGFYSKEEGLLDAILANQSKMKSVLSLTSLVTSHQCHEDHIVEVVEPCERVFAPSADGMFTQLKQLGLTTYHADCQIAFFYDPTKGVIANVHCGWRGNVQNIFGKTVKCLEERFGCFPKDLIVGVSPSLGPSHAEFIDYEKTFPKSFFSYQVRPYYFDLWEISYQQLLQAGVHSSHIEIARLCTYADKESFFSYRRDKTSRRNASVIGFK